MPEPEPWRAWLPALAIGVGALLVLAALVGTGTRSPVVPSHEARPVSLPAPAGRPQRGSAATAQERPEAPRKRAAPRRRRVERRSPSGADRARVRRSTQSVPPSVPPSATPPALAPAPPPRPAPKPQRSSKPALRPPSAADAVDREFGL